MRTLVVGYGSIGQRHARLLGDLGCEVGVVSSREVDHSTVYHDLVAAMNEWRPQYVIVANKTSEHYDTLSALANGGFGGRVLVEKPIFDCVRNTPPNRFSHLAVAYNMRFHPLVKRLRDFVDGQKCLSAYAYVGQYLPNWRPATDYRAGYSAKRLEGGGVLRDLSHELDYMNWLFGGWRRLAALGGHYSHLEIDSDDQYSLLMEMGRCPIVGVNVNYLDRVLRREVIVHSEQHSVRVDFVKGTFEIDGKVEQVAVERDATYIGEHRAMLEGDFSSLCNEEQGLGIIRMIESAENAATRKIWVTAS